MRMDLLVATLLIAAPSCGGDVVVESSGGEALDAGDDAASLDAGAEPLAPCHCTSVPHVVCEKPMECCPTVGACKDPASFSCSGSAVSCP